MNASFKFFLRILLRLFYGVRVEGMEHYQNAGERVLIVANHTSLLDGILLYAWLPETPTFAINTQVADQPRFRLFLKFVDLFIMDPSSPLSVKSMIKFIRKDRKAVIFPEGRITTTGVLMKIYEGPGLVADKAEAMILPIAIDGAQLSPLSYLKGTGHIRWFPRISMKVLPPERITIPSDIKGHARRKAAAGAMQKIMFKLTYNTYDHRKTLFQALLIASERYGKKQIIVEDIYRQPLSYKDLFNRAIILSRLIKKQTSKGEHIGVLLPNVSTTVVIITAIQFLSRVLAMLNYSSGTQAILRACHAAQIRTIYTSRRFIENAKLEDLIAELEQRLNIIYLEDLAGQLSIFDKLSGLLTAANPLRGFLKHNSKPNSDDPAVILFTSGSEGHPKGVVLSHANILSNFAQVRCHISFNPSDIVFSCLPFFHSFGLNAGCFMPILGGSKIFIYPSPLHYRVIPEMIYEIGATILFGTSTFFKGYARYAHNYDFHSLRYTVAGAEKLRDDTKQIWMERFGIRIYEGYGVTETSPVISVNTPVVYKQGCVGQFLPQINAYTEPVEGITEGGKLVVEGPNIMLGYLLHDKPGEIQTPNTDRGHGWHDTGDIATIDDEGFITIQGRAKRFAKIGGEMVSLTAVEELAMETWPNFNHAAVSLPDDRKGEKIVLVTDNRDALKKHIHDKAKVLKYGELYIPRKVVLAEELPLLSTGKINYITLTEMALAEDENGSGWISKIASFIKKEESPVVQESSTEEKTYNENQ